MGNVKISAFSNQPDLSLIEGLAGYEGSVGSYTNARISGAQLQTWLQNNLTFATASGTLNYVAKFTSTSGLVDSNIIDDGNNIGIFSPVDTDTLIQVRGASSTEKYGLRVNGESSTTSGVQGFGAAISAGVNFAPTVDIDDPRYGLRAKAIGGMRYPYGVLGEAFNGIEAVGGHFKAVGASSDLYSLRLEDGTEGANKFLKCITSDGKANWADLPATVGTLTINSTIGSSSSVPLTITDDGADNYTLNPFVYAGTTNVGFVPTGGTAQKLLAGDGSWQSPTFTAKQFPFSGVDVDPILSVNVGETGSPAVPVTTGQIRLVGGTNANVTRTNDNTITITADGGGTVSSVGLTMPAAFAVTGSPVTSSGTLAVTTTGGGADEYLKSDGTWDTPAGTYTLPLAANGTRGGIQIGFLESGKNYPVELASEKAYVNVPWTDNNDNTTYSISSTQTSGTNSNPNLTLTGANPTSTDDVQFIGDVVTVTRTSDDIITWGITAFAGSTKGAVPSAAVGDAGKFLKADGTWAVPTNTGLTSVGLVMTSIPGFSVTGSPLTSNGDITVAPTGGISGQYLDYQGEWNTPANTTYTAGQGISIVGTTISVATTGTIEVGDLKVDGKIENGTGVDLDIDSTEDIKLDATKDVEITATGSTTGIKLDSDKMVTVEAKEAISLDIKNTATGATPINAQPRLGGAMVVHGDTTGGGAYDGSITLNCSADTHGVTIKSPPHSAAATYTLVLPTSTGSNTEVLQTDGSGNLSWATNGGSSGGGFPSAVTASSTAATSAAVDTLYTITTTSGVADIVVTLPTAASNSAKIIGVKYAGQNSVNDTVVIKTLSSQTIDGTNRTTNGLPLASVGTYFELISDGSNWWIK